MSLEELKLNLRKSKAGDLGRYKLLQELIHKYETALAFAKERQDRATEKDLLKKVLGELRAELLKPAPDSELKTGSDSETGHDMVALQRSWEEERLITVNQSSFRDRLIVLEKVSRKAV
ncbi:MAG: hypothetical protein WCX27_02200 [Candidatus Paceibacterota bacterium]|jgi:hypothetical protein